MADNLPTPIGLIAAKDMSPGATGAGPYVQRFMLVGPNGEVIPASNANGYLVNVSAVAGNVNVLGPLTDAQLRAAAVPVAQQGVSSAVCTNFSAGSTVVTLVSALAGRKGLIIFNDADTNLYLKYGTGASYTSFTVRVRAGGYWEMPSAPVYTGAVSGIWALTSGGGAPTGAARITEV